MTKQQELEAFWENCCPASKDNFNKLVECNFMPFIGAGMSVAFGYKTWYKFLYQIIHSFPTDDQKPFSDMLRRKEYLKLADIINAYLNNGIEEYVRIHFGPSTMKTPKNNYITLLEDMGIKEFITTNYDEVIEKNHKDNTLKILLPGGCNTKEDIAEANRTGSPYLIKLHGSYDIPDSIVLTGEQYIEKYCNQPCELLDTLMYLWETKTFLFMGCSLEKDYLVEKILSLAGKTKRIWNYAILEMPTSKNKLRAREVELTRLKIRPIWYPAKDHNYVYTILQMLSGKESISTTIPSKKLDTKKFIQQFECYVDQLAKQAYEKGTQQKLYQALLSQQKNSKDISLRELCFKILASRQKCRLKIQGEPGTGKSTLFSLLYLEICQSSPDFLPLLVDMHFYDGKEHEEALKHLNERMNAINSLLDSNQKIVLFIDGLNMYKRSNDFLEDEIYKRLSIWKSNANISFCYSIGSMTENQFPPFSLDENIRNLPGISVRMNNYALTLESVNVHSAEFRTLLENTLEFYEIFTPDMMRKQYKSKRETIRNKFAICCIKASGNHVEFRTVKFLAISHILYGDMIYTKPIGRTFWDYYTNIMSQYTIYNTAKYVADFMLNKHEIAPLSTHYVVYKSPSVRDFFFAFYYVESIKMGQLENLKIFDCIFTPCINRFSVDLITMNQQTEKIFVQEIVRNFQTFTLKQQNQAAYLLGRVKSRDAKELSISFLKELYKEELDYIEHNADNKDRIMLFRTIGVSLIYIGEHSYEDDFYRLIIFNKPIREINRNFHIAYYTTENYKVGDDIELESAAVCSSSNIQMLYQFLYHSVAKTKSREAQSLNIITLLNLVIYDHYNNKSNWSKNFNPPNLEKLLNELKKDSSITNQTVKNYILNVSDFILDQNIYATAFDKLYNLKRTVRSGWLKPEREIHKTERPESVADHTWACCLLAEILLTDCINKCEFMSEEERTRFEKDYCKNQIILLLLFHDLPEACTGDIPTGDKTVKHEKNEAKCIQTMRTLDAFPFLHSFGNISELWNEFNEGKTFNAKIARDIDKLEPLIQLYIYRQILPSETAEKVKLNWMNSVNSSLKTAFGRKVFNFLVKYLLTNKF